MKKYTKDELNIMIENSNSKEALSQISKHVFEFKTSYPNWIEIQYICMQKILNNEL